MTSRKGSSRKRLPQLPSVQDLRELERLKQNEVATKAKIRSLELEVETLKYRLDSLRKAKNTTIVRREREEVRISSPKLGRHRGDSSSSLSSTPQDTHSSHCHENLQKQLDRQRTQLLAERAEWERGVREEWEGRVEGVREEQRREVEKLRGKYEEQVEGMRSVIEKLREMVSRAKNTEVPHECKECDRMKADVEKLQVENGELAGRTEEVLDVNSELRESHLKMQRHCETLLEDLSVKEALWSQKEEELKAEIRRNWGERYQQWISKAEKKMEELQQVNTLLQQMLRSKQHTPDTN